MLHKFHFVERCLRVGDLLVSLGAWSPIFKVSLLAILLPTVLVVKAGADEATALQERGLRLAATVTCQQLRSDHLSLN